MMMKKGGKGKTTSSSKLLPNSWRIVSSCLKTVSKNASTVVRFAGASVAAAIASSVDDHKDQVTWAGFDTLEFRSGAIKHVLLLGYVNGFQVIDVEDASNFNELVSKRDGPVTFLQMLPVPSKSDAKEDISSLHPVLLVVAGDEDNQLVPGHNHNKQTQLHNFINPSKAVQFYSIRSHCFVKVLTFPSAVLMLRSSPQIIAVGLKSQICCIDSRTLEKKFNVLTYPVPQFEGQGPVCVNSGYGPMALGPRWLAYAPDSPYVSSVGHLNPKNLTPSGVSPSTSPGHGSLIAHYAMESGKQFASGIINLGDMGYKTISKYCPDLLPDGAGSPGWKVGKLTASEMEKAGMVVIKDVFSTAVVSQFRAHTSPISALCFDPSGTLLVTASVHGNNINVFRIMPSCRHSGEQYYDWNSSYAHLYRLYRGVTAAIIQDICFSHCSQWIAIVSSKGTCHIFLQSPYGGDAHFLTLHSHGEGTFIYPVSSPPWWSTSSFTLNQQEPLPPCPSTLSVITRIESSNFGLLNTVNSAATSATGMTLAPSGAIAATFHASISHGLGDVNSVTSSLQHLLVCTPSGFVVQHKLLPSTGIELAHGSTKNRPGSHVIQDEAFGVNVEPVQWWEVCRRSDFPERCQCNFGTSSDVQECPAIVDNSRMIFVDKGFASFNKFVKKDTPKASDRSKWYLSNAEVHMNSGRSPIWQNTKICFYMMNPPRGQGSAAGELEIERVPSQTVEIKEKDLLPVFDHFHSVKSGWFDREVHSRSNSSVLENCQARDKVNEVTAICHSNPASLSSTRSSDGGSSRRVENLLDLDQLNIDKPLVTPGHTPNELSVVESGCTNYGAHTLENKSTKPVTFPSEHLSPGDYCVKETIPGSFSLKLSKPTSSIRTIGIGSPTSSANVAAKLPRPSGVIKTDDFGHIFQESYCNVLEPRSPCVCCQLTEIVTDELETRDGPFMREEPQDDGLHGGVYDFSEEG